jgi:hypothetical protein
MFFYIYSANKNSLIKKLFILLIFFITASCRSYHDVVIDYHNELAANNYQAAEKELLKSRFLKRTRNQILLYLELGKVLHLQQQYDSSNFYFNKADLLMDNKTVVADISTSVLLNEAMTRYKGEDFERVLIHYYKALNYIFLNNNDDALVEAKRINLRLNELNDKKIMDGKRYKSDAMAHTLQGFVYERQNDYNNAFIAYRNAYELYEKSPTLEYMGTTLPQQLKIDLINAAHKSGFYSDRDMYCKKFGLDFNSVKNDAKQELLFIWENGIAPIKEQEDIVLFLVKGVGGDLVFSNKEGTINIPFPLPDKQNEATKLSDLNVIRIAFPKYTDVPSFYNSLTVKSASTNYLPTVAENVAFIARENLRERFLKELTLTISRIVLKKLAEAELKKENETAGALLGIAGALSEKADTRNWQSLPNTISYTRVPLNAGQNKLVIKLKSANGQETTDTLNYNARPNLNFINYKTLKHFPPVSTANY